MSPRVQFTKEQLIDTAFDIAVAEGLQAVTVRKVAGALGCSVAPIYVNFKTSGDLIDAVLRRTDEITFAYMQKDYGQTPFLNMGIGMIMVAKDYSRLFRDIILNKSMYTPKENSDYDKYLDLMKKDTHMRRFSDKDLLDILLKVNVFTQGLALLASDPNSSKNFTLEEIIRLLYETGSDMILGTIMRSKGESPIDKCHSY